MIFDEHNDGDDEPYYDGVSLSLKLGNSFVEAFQRASEHFSYERPTSLMTYIYTIYRTAISALVRH